MSSQMPAGLTPDQQTAWQKSADFLRDRAARPANQDRGSRRVPMFPILSFAELLEEEQNKTSNNRMGQLRDDVALSFIARNGHVPSYVLGVLLDPKFSVTREKSKVHEQLRRLAGKGLIEATRCDNPLYRNAWSITKIGAKMLEQNERWVALHGKDFAKIPGPCPREQLPHDSLAMLFLAERARTVDPKVRYATERELRLFLREPGRIHLPLDSEQRIAKVPDLLFTEAFELPHFGRRLRYIGLEIERTSKRKAAYLESVWATQKSIDDGYLDQVLYLCANDKLAKTYKKLLAPKPKYDPTTGKKMKGMDGKLMVTPPWIAGYVYSRDRKKIVVKPDAQRNNASRIYLSADLYQFQLIEQAFALNIEGLIPEVREQRKVCPCCKQPWPEKEKTKAKKVANLDLDDTKTYDEVGRLVEEW